MDFSVSGSAAGTSATTRASAQFSDTRLLVRRCTEHDGGASSGWCGGCFGGGAHDDHVHLEDDRSDRSSGEQDDRADKMLSREEFAQCFRGVPKFSEELVDDFLYLFELNSEGQIEFEEFVKVVKELKVLVHEAEK